MDEDGIITINKERLVEQGFRQLEGWVYDVTRSHVARLEVVRLLLSCTSYINFELCQMDVKNDFLHGDLDH